MTVYDTRTKSAEDLKATFVCGKGIFGEIMKSLQPQKNGGLTNQSWIITGSRGAGKTHLITHLYHSIREDETLKGSWLPLSLPEELMGGGNLLAVLKPITKHLFIACEKAGENLSAETVQREKQLQNKRIEGPKREQEEARKEIEDEFLALWVAVSRETGKKLVLLIENLQEVMVSKLRKNDLQKLRSFMHEHTDCMIIVGTALTVFDELVLPDEPFYHFFRIQSLERLDMGETLELLKKDFMKRGKPQLMERVERQKGYVNVYRILTSGNSRMVRLLADLFEEKERLEIGDILQKITGLTPYFKHETDILSNQKQLVLEALSHDLPAMTVKEIAEYVGESLQQTMETLTRLQREGKVGIIDIEPGDGVKRRETFYAISDYLYRIWLQMRQGMVGEDNLEWMAELYSIVYTDAFTSDGFACEGETPLHRMARSKAENPLFRERMQTLCDLLTPKPPDGIVDEEFKQIREILVNDDSTTEDLEKAKCLIEKRLERKPDNHNAWFLMGFVLGELGKHEESVEAYRKGVAVKPDMHEAWFGMGYPLYNLGKHEESVEACRKAVALKPDFHEAWSCMGFVLGELGKFGEAVEAYRKAVAVKPDYYDAWCNMGCDLNSLGKHEEALEAFDKANRNKPPAFDRFDLAEGIFYGEVLAKTTTSEKALREFEEGTSPEERFKAGIVLLYLGSFDGIEALFQRAFEKLEENRETMQEAFFHFGEFAMSRLSGEEKGSPVIAGNYWFRAARALSRMKQGDLKSMMLSFLAALMQRFGEKVSLGDLLQLLESWEREEHIPEIVPRLLKAIKSPNSREAKVLASDPLIGETLRLLLKADKRKRKG